MNYFIGWDVGGWGCKPDSASQDAIVILDTNLSIVGTPWRGNLRDTLVYSATTQEWLTLLFKLCGAVLPLSDAHVTMAIDTPLGFPEDFVNLITTKRTITPHALKSGLNNYLFRKTERILFERGHPPLSSLRDQIGSQATKGIHAISRFAPYLKTCGVWWDDTNFDVIETYPTPCRNNEFIKQNVALLGPFTLPDIEDACVCALVASLFVQNLAALIPPPNPCTPTLQAEGWIWVTA